MKTIKTFLCTGILLTALAHSLFAQDEDVYEYVFEMVNHTMDTELPESYVGLGNWFNPLDNRVLPLTPEEGSENYTVEAFIPIKFALLQQREKNIERNSKRYSSFFTYSRLFIDYGFHVRVPKGEVSSPILPPTNRWGIRFDKMFNVRADGEFLNNGAVHVKREELVPERVDSNKTYSYHNLSIYLHHYSNGQGAGSLVDPAVNRNDYLSGDFSTNFIRGSWGYHQYKPNNYLFGIYAGFQREIGNDDGFFSFRAAQENRYGKNRIMAGALFNKAINLGWLAEQINFRADIEWILDNKSSLYEYPYDNKHPLALHLFVDLPLKKLRAMGIMFHYFRGRDYLNIRYDDPVSAFQIGLTMKIQRFTVKHGDGEAIH